MSGTKITNLYQYLLFYGAVPHMTAPGSFRSELPSEENFWNWREYQRHTLRERDRLTLPPKCTPPSYHWPHIRIVKDEETPLVAFYASEDAAKRDRRTRCTYGRYLTKYFGHALSEKEITEHATNFRGNYGNNCLLFAKTAEEITNVFLTGPNSCMSKPLSYYATGGIHPSAFYGNGITEIAFLRNHGKITARTVTLKDKKVFSTVYGDQAIKLKLKAAGYHQGDINGVDFPALPLPDTNRDNLRFILPFIDGASYGLYNYKNAQMSFYRERPETRPDHASFSPRNTDGTTAVPRTIPTAPALFVCVHCGASRNSNTASITTSGQKLCNGCASLHYTVLRTRSAPTYHYGIPPGTDVYRVHGYSTRYCKRDALDNFSLTPLYHKFDGHGTQVAAHQSEVVTTLTGCTSLRDDCIQLTINHQPAYCDPQLEELEAGDKIFLQHTHGSVLLLAATAPDPSCMEFSTTDTFRKALAGGLTPAFALFANHYNQTHQKTA